MKNDYRRVLSRALRLSERVEELYDADLLPDEYLSIGNIAQELRKEIEQVIKRIKK